MITEAAINGAIKLAQFAKANIFPILSAFRLYTSKYMVNIKNIDSLTSKSLKIWYLNGKEQYFNLILETFLNSIIG